MLLEECSQGRALSPFATSTGGERFICCKMRLRRMAYAGEPPWPVTPVPTHVVEWLTMSR